MLRPRRPRAPKVTAIIIFLNGEEFIAESIESVLAQTFNDWELVLCDDGSTDGATAIAQDYARRFPDRIRYVEHPGHQNLGMSAARMLGVRNSTGQYIAWLDADDVWKPNKQERQVAILEGHPDAAMVYGRLTYWYGWTGKPEDLARDSEQNLGVETNAVHLPPEIFLRFMQNMEHHPSGVMVRREVLEAVGGYEPAFRGEYEDVVAQTKVCLNYPVYAADESWYLYRRHAQSCTAATYRQKRDREIRLVYLRWLEKYLADREVSPLVREALAQALDPYSRRGRYLVSQLALSGARVAHGAARTIGKCLLPRSVYSWMRAKYWNQHAGSTEVQTGRNAGGSRA